jgi:hypothetical protein
MSVLSSPSRTKRVQLEERPDVGMICRARKVVSTLGGRFSLELGIELDRDSEEVERWALAATLFGNRISTAIAIDTYRVFQRAGVETIADAGRRGRRELVGLLDLGGYARYDERTASRLHALADALADRYSGRLATLDEQVADPTELERALCALPGWSPATVRIFLRELRGVWRGADPELDERAAAAARHVDLPTTLGGLSSAAVTAHLDVRDLESALVRLALCHDLAACPGSEECPFASFDPPY